jgi:Mitosis protein DIM1
MGSVVLPHLVTAWHVDQAIMSEDERLVVIRFGRDWDPDCMRQDEVLYRIADRVKNFAVWNVGRISLEERLTWVGNIRMRPRSGARLQTDVR